MHRARFPLALLASIFATDFSHAALVTLDFEQFAPQTVGVNFVAIPDFDENGFHIADNDNGIFSTWGATNLAYAGNVAIQTGGTDSTIVTENNSTNFRVHSITLSARNPDFLGVDTDIVLGGIDAGGTSFSETYTTNTFNLQEIFMGSAFYNVQEFSALQSLNGEQFQISAITLDTEPTVSAVPIPATAWLFGSAFSGLIVLRKPA